MTARKPRGKEPRSGRLPAGRKADVLAYVNEHHQVSVAVLAGHFGVSADTVRRDLDELDSQGALIRTHGGAVSTSLVPDPDTGTEVRARLHAEDKQSIADAAAACIRDGASLFVNGGTTTLAVMRKLRQRRQLRVVTNNLLLPEAVVGGAVEELFLVGGPVRASAMTTTGPLASAFGLDCTQESGVEFRCDVALIGVGAVDAKGGFSTSHLAEAVLIDAMARHATTVIVVADSSKFGRTLFARIGALRMADVLVTDSAPSAELAEALAAEGVTVNVADALSPGAAD
ncbi:DeoR/GlpR family DNA-binding transcription regulator [Streptomyces sp. NPDC004111]|uniref:DeoR/GlpR family DNA-binding transcription regulator n=1 Tax=Streptomyces sp. NPDC004111 TaxID=3364690 RepID=UPI00367449A3